MKIALLSDSHSHIDQAILTAIEGVDEIWHAGDIGSWNVIDELQTIASLRVVYGNIDDHTFRAEYPLDLHFEIQGLQIFMTHIGGYPGRYSSRVRAIFSQTPCDIFICGHSHISKVMRDPKYNHLMMNPGAIGHHGFHAIRTLLLFEINDGKLDHLQVVELGRRGRGNGA